MVTHMELPTKVFRGLHVARGNFAVDRKRVFTLKTQGHSQANFLLRGRRTLPLLGECLEHQGSAAEREPAPAKLSIHDPLMLH